MHSQGIESSWPGSLGATSGDSSPTGLQSPLWQAQTLVGTRSIASHFIPLQTMGRHGSRPYHRGIPCFGGCVKMQSVQVQVLETLPERTFLRAPGQGRFSTGLTGWRSGEQSPNAMKQTFTFLGLLVASLTGLGQAVPDGTTNVLTGKTNSFTGDVTIGTNSPFTLLVLSDNSLLTNTANGVIGRNSAARSNEVQLLSASARWFMGGNLFVGNDGAFNRLTVSNGANVRNSTGYLGPNGGSSNNIGMVTGSGST